MGVGAGEGAGVGVGLGLGVGTVTHEDQPLAPAVYLPVVQGSHNIAPGDAAKYPGAHAEHCIGTDCGEDRKSSLLT